MAQFDKRLKFDSISDYWSEHDIISGNSNAYVWPSRAANKDNQFFGDLSLDEDIETIFALAERETAVPEPSGLEEQIQLFAGRRPETDNLPVVSMPQELGAERPEEVRELYRNDEIPDIDLEIGWPADVMTDFEPGPVVRREMAKGKLDDVRSQCIRAGFRNGIKMSNEMLDENGTVMLRIDDFEEYDVAEPMENDLAYNSDKEAILSFYMDSEFGFEESYLLEERSTGHTYVVGHDPKPYQFE